MLKEIEERRDELETKLEQSREKRNELNAQASELAAKRNELNAQARELVEQAQELKAKRDEFNALVSEYKAKRDEFNAKANELLRDVDKMRKDLKLSEGPSLSELKKEIESLEFRQQTEVLSISKEREIVDKITALRKEFFKKKKEFNENPELTRLMEEVNALKEEASNYHRMLTEQADLAQECHDQMMALFKQADRVRGESDAAHRKFVEAQEVADESHERCIRIQKELRELDGVIGSEKRSGRKTKHNSKLLSEAEKVYQQFIDGEKLDTEKLMILQKSGLLYKR
ncbi:MAG: coiled-coil protein [Methermicoccaceae archaeon]